jgi:50S ribosomal protein L16 3-hydroxylase
MEVILEPGDILYIPAKHAHLGVSIENSMTYSVGFRAPSIRDIVDGVATSALEELKEDDRYCDSEESLQAPRGEIPRSAINALQKMLIEAFSDETLVSSWLGEYVTERKYPDLELMGDNSDDWRSRVNDGECIERNPASRFAYTRLNGCELYVDGELYVCSLLLAEELANKANICSDKLLELTHEKQDDEVVSSLIERGALVFV